MIAIVDYGAGNLTSVRNAFAALGAETVVAHGAEAVATADRVVFPGVGAAGKAMENLRSRGLVEAVCRAAAEKPFLGICLGMQILFERTEEDGGVDCLGLLGGKVARFPDAPGVKVPEIGWNDVEWGSASAKASPFAKAMADKSADKSGNGVFYFVHSYYAEIVPETCGVSEYAGVKFTAMTKRGRFWACQFHPEKSGRVGLELLKEWLSC